MFNSPGVCISIGEYLWHKWSIKIGEMSLYRGSLNKDYCPATLPRDTEFPIATEWEGGWTSGPVWMGWEKSRVCRKSNPVRPLRSHPLDWLSYLAILNERTTEWIGNILNLEISATKTFPIYFSQNSTEEAGGMWFYTRDENVCLVVSSRKCCKHITAGMKPGGKNSFRQNKS
jgi:hypothetical protein